MMQIRFAFQTYFMYYDTPFEKSRHWDFFFGGR